MMDFEQAAYIHGSRSTILLDDLAKLERALSNFFLDFLAKYGYIETSMPPLVKEIALFGTGQLPKFAEDSFHTTDNFWLIATSEITMSNWVANKIITEEELPLRLTACTSCFRSEAGSAGKDTRGMLRQFHFKKVEMVSITTPDKSKEEQNANNSGSSSSNLKGTGKTNKNTSVRIAPLINSSKIANLKNNSEVNVIEELNGWAYIQTDEISGWVRTNNITIDNDNNATDKPSDETNKQSTDSNKTSDSDKDNKDNSTDENNSDDKDNTDKNNDNSNKDDNNSDFTKKTMYTTNAATNIRSEASTNSNIVMVVSINTALEVIGEEGEWYKVSTSEGDAYVSKDLLSNSKTDITNRGGIDRTSNENTSKKVTTENVSKKENASTSSSTKASEIVSYAKKFLGVPYVYGGASPSGFDCSGFTMYVYNHFGISMRHGAQAQAKLGEKVSANKSSKSSLLNNLKVGDLVFFLDYETMDEIGHCGIYIGNGNFIHASSGSGYCVKINSLLPGEYYNTRYCAARRIL